MSFPSPEHNPCPDMAEDEVTPEQLAAIAAENEEPEPVDYKPPAQKTVQELHELDRDDESLRKYKEALLGAGVSVAGNALCVCVCVCVWWNGIWPECTFLWSTFSVLLMSWYRCLWLALSFVVSSVAEEFRENLISYCILIINIFRFVMMLFDLIQLC